MPGYNPDMDPHENLAAWRRITSPLGAFLLGCRADGSLVTDWPDCMGHPWPGDSTFDPRCLPKLAELLRRYFAGEAVDPARTEVPAPAGPPFYRSCWDACRAIPLGSTLSYAELARRAGNPRALRAAGGGMRSNPMPILVPCHRVITSSGQLGGFAGHRDLDSPALRLKRTLLEMEAASAATIDATTCKDLLPCA